MWITLSLPYQIKPLSLYGQRPPPRVTALPLPPARASKVGCDRMREIFPGIFFVFKVEGSKFKNFFCKFFLHIKNQMCIFAKNRLWVKRY